MWLFSDNFFFCLVCGLLEKKKKQKSGVVGNVYVSMSHDSITLFAFPLWAAFELHLEQPVCRDQ